MYLYCWDLYRALGSGGSTIGAASDVGSATTIGASNAGADACLAGGKSAEAMINNNMKTELGASNQLLMLTALEEAVALF